VSVDAYTGLPGSGKSYSAIAQQVLPALKAGRHVVTNLPLKLDLVEAELGGNGGRVDLVDLQEIEAAPERMDALFPPGCVAILDEVWRLFPAGRKVDRIPEPYKAFFAEHRHRVDATGNSTQIVLVCQDLAQIAAFARQLVETTYRTTKLTTLGLSKRFRVDVYHGPVSGPNPPVTQALRRIFGRYDRKVYRYYVSHTQSESATEGANEASVDRRNNLLLRPAAVLVPLGIVGLVGWGLWRLHVAHQELLHPKGPAKRDGFVTLAAAGPGAVGAGGQDRQLVWHLTGRFEGLCWQGGCGWALVERGEESRWLPLHDCWAVGPNWTCRYPVDGAASSSAASAPARRAGGAAPGVVHAPATIAGAPARGFARRGS
jgi:zona occludens toxin